MVKGVVLLNSKISGKAVYLFSHIQLVFLITLKYLFGLLICILSSSLPHSPLLGVLKNKKDGRREKRCFLRNGTSFPSIHREK